jgi:adenylate cyclase
MNNTIFGAFDNMADEQLRNSLLSHAVRAYQMGYVLLAADLTIIGANVEVSPWLACSPGQVLGRPVTEAFPELVGMEEAVAALDETAEPFRLESIYRASAEGQERYFDLQLIRLAAPDGRLLLTTADVTGRTQHERALQQQRNVVQMLSAELGTANERLSYIVKRLLPAPVAASLLAERRLPAPGGEMVREATVLFADMRDFTAYAEAYQPADTLEFLNTYLAVVAEAVQRHEGSLVQLVGDLVMGVFNIPEEQPDHTRRAIRAAADIQASLRAYQATAQEHHPPVGFGVGISTGLVVAGYLGVQYRFRYSVVGDATNVAFHLSSLAAPGRVLVSESTLAGAGDDVAALEKGNFQLKRRRQWVKVYELILPERAFPPGG